MLKLLILIIIFLNIISSYSLPEGVINFPFKKSVPDLTNISADDIIIKGLYNNEITTEINLGTEPQKIPMIIDLFYYDFFVAGENEDKNKNSSKIIFQQSKSKTFNENGLFGQFGGRGFSLGYKSTDIFINNDNNKKYNISFILAMDPSEKISGMIGLKLNSQEDDEILEYNFIKQLKKVNAIKDYYFTIKYINNTNGNLIIGDLPENYDSKYRGIEYKDIYVNNPDSPTSWNIRFDSIYTKSPENNYKTDLGKFDIYFRLNFGVTIGNEEYRQEFKNSFMEEQIDRGNCFEKISLYYYVYYCNNEVNFSKMKNLYFYNKELNYDFEFSYKDLFFYNELDKKYYFLIIFEKSNGSGRWLMGEFFFKKYQLIFNQEKKKIGIYLGKIKVNDNEEKTWFSKNKWYLILIVFLICLLIAVSIMIYLYIQVKPKRKIKANELIDDDYEYTINK